MAALGIRLDQRVRVTLVEPDVINLGGPGLCLGRTLQRIEDSVTDVLGIEIARGLTATHFGATVAHEGLCELFSGAWLKRRGTEFARTMRRVALENPDPVYGAGYRMVRDAVVSHGIAVVLDSVCARSRLP
jgi:hypothetical protein